MPSVTVNQQKNIDSTDFKIINLLMAGQSSQQIAVKLRYPLSTVQRRIRVLREKDLVKFKPEVDYSRMGLKKGLLHVYLHDGNMDALAETLLDMKGVLSTSVHLGNSDIVLEFVFGGSNEVLDLISKVRHQESVEKVVWSEEVHRISKPIEFALNGRSN